MTTPDRWVIVKVTTDETPYFKVLAGWSGGYLHGDSWRLNSGISKVEREGDFYLFHGYSGSVYRCHVNGYGLNIIMIGILNTLEQKGVELVEEQDFLTLLDKPE